MIAVCATLVRRAKWPKLADGFLRGATTTILTPTTTTNRVLERRAAKLRRAFIYMAKSVYNLSWAKGLVIIGCP